MRLETSNNLFTLTGAIGTSAYAYYTDFLSQVTDGKSSESHKLNPVYNFWDKRNKTIQSQVGDGYICDNTGILSLLSRNVKRIIAFDNNSYLNGSYENTSLS